MVKVKTSIYVNKDLWEKFKRYALRMGIEVSNLLEDMMREELIEEVLDETLLNLAGFESYEIDFKPIKPKEGYVSELVRVMRNERAGSISR